MPKDYGLGLRDSALRVICPQPKWSRAWGLGLRVLGLYVLDRSEVRCT